MNYEDNIDFSIYDYLPIGICIIDESYEIKYWNRRLVEWTGLDKNGTEGKNLLNMYPNLSKPVYKMRIDLMFKGNPPTLFSSLLHKYFIPVKISENDYQVQSTTLVSIPKKDSQRNYVLIAIENETNLHNRFNKYKQMKNKAMAEIKRREAAEEKILEYIAKLEETNASKDKFFSIIAHDLKSPFTGFLNLTKILAEQLKDMSINEISEMTTVLQESANTLYKLLENLLEWSRIQRGTIQFNPTELNLNYLVKSNFDIQREIANNKNITLINSIDEDLELVADVSMVNTIIRNLLSNALKFTKKGGSVELSSQKSESHIEVSVKDTGIGIPEEKINKLFDIGENVSILGTEGEPSTGLGLILCKEFVELHKGKMIVESEINKGSKFTFSIPIDVEN